MGQCCLKPAVALRLRLCLQDVAAVGLAAAQSGLEAAGSSSSSNSEASLAQGALAATAPAAGHGQSLVANSIPGCGRQLQAGSARAMPAAVVAAARATQRLQERQARRAAAAQGAEAQRQQQDGRGHQQQQWDALSILLAPAAPLLAHLPTAPGNAAVALVGLPVCRSGLWIKAVSLHTLVLSAREARCHPFMCVHFPPTCAWSSAAAQVRPAAVTAGSCASPQLAPRRLCHQRGEWGGEVVTRQCRSPPWV